MSQNGPMLSDSAFTAALQEYEEDTETEENGEDIDVGYIGYELSRSCVATNMCTYGHAVTRHIALNLYPFALYHAPSTCCSQQVMGPGNRYI